MQLNLTEHDAELLRGLLQDQLPELRWEIARTEKHPLRRELIERQDLAERLVKDLQSNGAS